MDPLGIYIYIYREIHLYLLDLHQINMDTAACSQYGLTTYPPVILSLRFVSPKTVMSIGMKYHSRNHGTHVIIRTYLVNLGQTWYIPGIPKDGYSPKFIAK